MKKQYSRKLFALTAMLWLALAGIPAQAALQVDITDSSQSAIPIAISPFGGSLPVDVAQVASNDLESTGLFKVFSRNNMVATPSSPDQVNYDNWRTSSVDNLVVGSAQPNGQGGYRITFDLLDVYQGRSVASFQINAAGNELRDAAHTVANLVYEKFVGKKGYFLSRIAYITMAKEGGGLRYRLIVSDYDGNNPATVYSSRDPIMSPAWSPDGSKLAYVAFDVNRGRSSLRVQDLASGNIREISSRSGINGAPAWSPDGRRLAMTLSFRGNPDIYTYDLNTNQLTQLTNNGAIDTEASWSPDGSRIVFTSDRGGKPQVYRMRSDGSSVERLSYDGESNQRASYSPDGKQLTLVQKSGNGFRIAVMDLDNNNIRIVSDGPLDDSPNFAPNGQAIIYAKQGRNNELATVSTDGQTRSRLSQSGEVREPAWGPLGY
ncbi:Tol-Pal system beta propeller repeat protein TolB [Salinisphaera sp. T31B1]|uniref:Tol-Pal system beta propeller repeat protein TolB n=1 Tax=Salinisphaera sp. T31B1 TaxID=727963 RepID=UPI00333F3655